MSENPNEELLEPDLFVNPSELYELKCPICLCVMKDPQQLSVCQHTFCKHCITTYFRSSPATNFCPVDMTEATASNIVPAPRLVVNIINRLEAKCFYHGEGCREIMRVENLQRHADGCRFRPCGPRRPAPPPSSTPGNGNGVPINIFVKLTSPAKTIVVTITGNDTVRTLKLRIQEKEGVDANNMVLNFKGKPLQDTESLSQYGIKNSDILWISRRFEGGIC